MSALQHYPLSLAGQIGRLIPAVAEFERQHVIQTEERQKAYAIRLQKLEQEKAKREHKNQKEIIGWLRDHPGSKTNEIAKFLLQDRCAIYHRLTKLEEFGLVVRSAQGKFLKWYATK